MCSLRVLGIGITIYNLQVFPSNKHQAQAMSSIIIIREAIL